MPILAMRDLGGLVSGRLGWPLVTADGLRAEDGLIVAIGPGAGDGPADTVLDAAGAVAIPGPIDSHAHVVFGDRTPRQSALGWIESSMHGGVSMMMSASEVHLPGRPRDRAGVKPLALAAQRAYSQYRPGGVALAGRAIWRGWGDGPLAARRARGRRCGAGASQIGRTEASRRALSLTSATGGEPSSV